MARLATIHAKQDYFSFGGGFDYEDVVSGNHSPGYALLEELRAFWEIPFSRKGLADWERTHNPEHLWISLYDHPNRYRYAFQVVRIYCNRWPKTRTGNDDWEKRSQFAKMIPGEIQEMPELTCLFGKSLARLQGKTVFVQVEYEDIDPRPW